MKKNDKILWMDNGHISKEWPLSIKLVILNNCFYKEHLMTSNSIYDMYVLVDPACVVE